MSVITIKDTYGDDLKVESESDCIYIVADEVIELDKTRAVKHVGAEEMMAMQRDGKLNDDIKRRIWTCECEDRMAASCIPTFDEE